jgi:dTDP-4-dehydrorhamnose reductase
VHSRGAENIRVVICGAAGQLGSELADVFQGAGDEVQGFDLDMDITDYGLLNEKIPPLAPDLVINSAAHVDADEAERDPDISYRINFVGTQNLALVCASLGVPLAFVSSDYVFDGLKGSAYNEFDEPCPRGVYGRAKLAAERYMSATLGGYYIFRTQWLFGKYGRKNFVKSILRNARDRGALRVVTDEVGTPTSCEDLARVMYEVTTSGKYGLYHATNRGSCSRFDFAREILQAAGWGDIPVEPIKYCDLDLPCPRPPFSPLDNMLLRLQGFTPTRDYHEPLGEYVSLLMDSGDF